MTLGLFIISLLTSIGSSLTSYILLILCFLFLSSCFRSSLFFATGTSIRGLVGAGGFTSGFSGMGSGNSFSWSSSGILLLRIGCGFLIYSILNSRHFFLKRGWSSIKSKFKWLRSCLPSSRILFSCICLVILKSSNSWSANLQLSALPMSLSN